MPFSTSGTGNLYFNRILRLANINIVFCIPASSTGSCVHYVDHLTQVMLTYNNNLLLLATYHFQRSPLMMLLLFNFYFIIFAFSLLASLDLLILCIQRIILSIFLKSQKGSLVHTRHTVQNLKRGRQQVFFNKSTVVFKTSLYAPDKLWYAPPLQLFDLLLTIGC